PRRTPTHPEAPRRTPLPLRGEIQDDDQAGPRRFTVRLDEEEALPVSGDVETWIRRARGDERQGEQAPGHTCSEGGGRLDVDLEHLAAPGEEEPAPVATPPRIAAGIRDFPAPFARSKRPDQKAGFERRGIRGDIADEAAVRG